MREVGLVTFAQSRYFNKYLLARIVAKNAKLYAELKERKAINLKLNAECLQKAKANLAALKTLEAQVRLAPDIVDYPNEMANSDSEEVRVLVQRGFGKYLKP